MFIQSRMVGSEIHNIHKSGVLSGNRIQGHPHGVSRNPQQGVVVIYSNVGLISQTYEDTATRKLQFRRFQLRHSDLTTVFREKSSNIHK